MDCTLGSSRDCLTGLGRHTLPYHSQVRLRFKLAAGLGEPWCRDGGIPQGCPLSMVFIVALKCATGAGILTTLPDVEAPTLC